MLARPNAIASPHRRYINTPDANIAAAALYPTSSQALHTHNNVKTVVVIFGGICVITKAYGYRCSGYTMSAMQCIEAINRAPGKGVYTSNITIPPCWMDLGVMGCHRPPHPFSERHCPPKLPAQDTRFHDRSACPTSSQTLPLQTRQTPVRFQF